MPGFIAFGVQAVWTGCCQLPRRCWHLLSALLAPTSTLLPRAFPACAPQVRREARQRAYEKALGDTMHSGEQAAIQGCLDLLRLADSMEVRSRGTGYLVGQLT